MHEPAGASRRARRFPAARARLIPRPARRRGWRPALQSPERFRVVRVSGWATGPRSAGDGRMRERTAPRDERERPMPSHAAGRIRAGSLVWILLLTATACGGSTPASSIAGSAGASPGSSPGPSASVMATTKPISTTTPTSEPSGTPPAIGLLPTLPTKPLPDAQARAFQAVLDDLVETGSPDAIAAVITPDGRWAGAAGIDGPNGRT